MTRRRWTAVAAAALVTMATADGQWATGDALPELRLPDVRFPEGLDPASEEAARARTVDLRRFRGKKLVLLEFASW